jgi:hypothetical protein
MDVGNERCRVAFLQQSLLDLGARIRFPLPCFGFRIRCLGFRHLLPADMAYKRM